MVEIRNAVQAPTFAQQIINGFVAGSAYALFALGVTLMFGVLGVINLTYGFYFSAGAYIALFAAPKGASALANGARFYARIHQ
jgi:branched-subunit amino acid ABC-type transport system permease component